MGFFSNIFSKKTCSVCGKEMGMLERKELKDGNLCNDCADKLSKWFEGRKECTAEQIKEQLMYREKNRNNLQNFHATRSIGKNVKVQIDEQTRRFLVSESSDLFKENPDIIDIPMITNVNLDTQKSEHELYDRDNEGHMVSYNPRRFDYSYDFYVEIYTNHPYAKHLRFRLNDSSVWVRYGEVMGVNMGSNMPTGGAGGLLGAVIGGVVSGMANNSNAGNAMFNSEYQQYVAMGEDIRNILMRLRSGNPMMGGQPMGMTQTQFFTFDSFNNPVGGRRLFVYKLFTPVNGVNVVNLFMNVTFGYNVFDPQKFSAFRQQFGSLAVAGLAEVLQQGLPCTPEQLAQNEGLLVSSFMNTNCAKELRSYGVDICNIKVNNFSYEQMPNMGQVAQPQMQQQMQPQNVQQNVPKFCPNCGAPVTGKFCESCGTKF